MKRTLSLRSWLALAIVLAALFSLLLAFGAALTGELFSGGARQNPAMALRSRVIGEWRSWESPAWQSDLRRELAALGVNMRLLNPQGRAIFQADPTPLTRFPQALWSHTQGDLTVANNFRSMDLTELRRGGELVGYVEMYMPWTERQAPVAEGRPLALALLIVGLGSALAVLVLLRVFVPPLRALAAAADRVRQGDLEFSLPASPVREVAGVLNAFTQMARGLREAVQRQAAMEEERRFFLAAVSHDLRTPLFTVRGRLEGIRDGVAATPEQMRHYAGQALKTLDRLDRLVADLFAYARLNLLAQAPDPAPIDLAVLLRQAAEAAQPLADAKGVALEVQGPSACPGVGDSHLLSRALANLLDNAIRHTPTGGVVRLGWTGRDSALSVWVEDSGPGISPEVLPHLFTAPQRGRPRSQESGGAGLGLVIVRRAVEAHGGTVQATNLPDGGARFTLVLPTGR